MDKQIKIGLIILCLSSIILFTALIEIAIVEGKGRDFCESMGLRFLKIIEDGRLYSFDYKEVLCLSNEGKILTFVEND